MSNDISRSRTFYINSQNRLNKSNSTSTDFSFQLPITIQDYKWCVLTGASIPKTWYLVDQRHNTFILDEDGSTVTITIPIGNYQFLGTTSETGNIPGLGAVIVNLLNSNSPNGWTYSVVPNLRTGYYTFTVTGNSEQPIFVISDLRLANLLGLQLGNNTFSGDSLTSVQICNFQLTSSVLVSCNVALPNQIIQDIYATEQNFSFLNFVQNEPIMNAKQVDKSVTNILTFKIIDRENNELLDLNGHEISLSITFFNLDTTQKTYFDTMLELQRLELEKL